ncbi:outer membrane beta-barrel protein [Microcoleus sp. FACHB-1515]|uniref:outer membrane beta-barrel protein n=1 Tax=Cyanophyceae TaxID=3028117 RepID=UPI0016889AF8|nr:outer membrane beta-barrel protein [Microcoleus sp. FACHB-1515]MBD2091823.1 outer membrane beta-barrel protein [Microcoleus sp. FACHB-1515]
MKFSKIATLSALAAVVVAPIVAGARPAAALPTGMEGTYVGAGVSAGVISGDGQDSQFGGTIQGRIDIPNVPVSARGAVLFTDDTSAIVPTLTYDIPISSRANIYAGAGYSFVDSDGLQTSPLGNQDSFVLTAGAETEVAPRVVVFGDAKLGFDAYQQSSDPALALQVGAGFRF